MAIVLCKDNQNCVSTMKLSDLELLLCKGQILFRHQVKELMEKMTFSMGAQIFIGTVTQILCKFFQHAVSVENFTLISRITELRKLDLSKL